MHKNFEIKDIVYLNFEDRLYDLHNDFDFKSITITSRELVVTFSNSTYNISFTVQSAKIIHMPYKFSEFIDYIGYRYPEDDSGQRGFLPEENLKDKDQLMDFVIGFEDGDFRVQADQYLCSVNKM